MELSLLPPWPPAPGPGAAEQMSCIYGHAVFFTPIKTKESPLEPSPLEPAQRTAQSNTARRSCSVPISPIAWLQPSPSRIFCFQQGSQCGQARAVPSFARQASSVQGGLLPASGKGKPCCSKVNSLCFDQGAFLPSSTKISRLGDFISLPQTGLHLHSPKCVRGGCAYWVTGVRGVNIDKTGLNPPPPPPPEKGLVKGRGQKAGLCHSHTQLASQAFPTRPLCAQHMAWGVVVIVFIWCGGGGELQGSESAP